MLTNPVQRPPGHEKQSGMTIVEVMLAMTVLAVGAFSALSTLTGAMALDEDLKERATAMRAAMFTVEGLKLQAGALSHGNIAFDVTDPDRIRVTVSVRWNTRRDSTRSLALPI